MLVRTQHRLLYLIMKKEIIKPLKYISPTHKRIFFNFLNSILTVQYNNILERFKINYRKYPSIVFKESKQRILSNIDTYFPQYILTYSFIWNSTPEGASFWANVHIAWIRYMQKHKHQFYV